jgi:hypothetical protein
VAWRVLRETEREPPSGVGCVRPGGELYLEYPDTSQCSDYMFADTHMQSLSTLPESRTPPTLLSEHNLEILNMNRSGLFLLSFLAASGLHLVHHGSAQPTSRQRAEVGVELLRPAYADTTCSCPAFSCGRRRFAGCTANCGGQAECICGDCSNPLNHPDLGRADPNVCRCATP